MRAELDFEKLVEKYYAPLYRFAISLTRNENDASDLTQETFLIWATKGTQLHDASKVKSWLFTTLHRQFLQSERRRDRHHDPVESDCELLSVDPELMTRLDACTVVEVLGQIDSAFRAPVSLFYLEDYSYKEIAEVLNIPLGTVKSRISRGIAQLKLAMASESPGRLAKKGNA